MGWIGDFVSRAVSLVSSAIGSVVGSIGGIAASFLKVATPYLGAISQIVQIVGMIMDILKPGEDPEELGAKAMEADKKPEDFESTSEYIDYLRNEVELDRKKFDNATDEQKFARQAVGSTIVSKAISEKKGFDIPMGTWIALAKLKMDDTSGPLVDKILDTFGKDGNLESFNDYVDGKISNPKKEIEVGNKISDMLQELNPNLSEEDIEKKVINMGDVEDRR